MAWRISMSLYKSIIGGVSTITYKLNIIRLFGLVYDGFS